MGFNSCFKGLIW